MIIYRKLITSGKLDSIWKYNTRTNKELQIWSALKGWTSKNWEPYRCFPRYRGEEIDITKKEVEQIVFLENI